MASSPQHSSAGNDDDWEDLFHTSERPQPASATGDATAAGDIPDASSATTTSAHAYDVSAALRNAVLRPLCLSVNQKFNRVAVGHERGFLVFHVDQDHPETFEEFDNAPAPTQTPTSKPSLSHLALDPFYNTDEDTFSAIRRRVWKHERKRQGQLPPGQDAPVPATGERTSDAHAASLVEQPLPQEPTHAAPQTSLPPPQPPEHPEASFHNGAASSAPLSAAPSASVRAYGDEISDVLVSDDSMVSCARQQRRQAVLDQKRRELAKLNELTRAQTTGTGHQGHLHMDTSLSSASYMSPATLSEMNRPVAAPPSRESPLPRTEPHARAATTPMDRSVTSSEGTTETHRHEGVQQTAPVFYETSESDNEERETPHLTSEDATRGNAWQQPFHGDDLFVSRVDESNLNLFLSYAHRGGGSAKRRAKAHQRDAPPKMRAGDSALPREAADVLPSPQAPLSEEAAIPDEAQIAWDSSAESDDYDFSEYPTTASATEDSSEVHAGLLSHRFLRGEETIGFYGGGVAAIALQYEQPHVALVGGGPTPMRRRADDTVPTQPHGAVHNAMDDNKSVHSGNGPERQDSGVGRDVFVLYNGCCRHVISLPDDVTSIQLDARLLYVMTWRELRIYTDPVEPRWARCGFTLPLASSRAPTIPTSLSPNPSMAGGGRDSGGPVLSVFSTTTVDRTVRPSTAPASASCLVLDVPRSLFLVRGPRSDKGFSLFRYTTALEPVAHGGRREDVSSSGNDDATPTAPPAFGSGRGFLASPTTVHVRCLATLLEAHKNPLATLALFVGPPLSTGPRTSVNADTREPAKPASASASESAEIAKEFGREHVYVAAASEYATRITLWKLVVNGTAVGAPTNDAAGESPPAPFTFALMHEFRVGFRLPSSAARLFRWGRGGVEGEASSVARGDAPPEPSASPKSFSDAHTFLNANDSFSGTDTYGSTASPSIAPSAGVLRGPGGPSSPQSPQHPQWPQTNDSPKKDLRIHHLQFLHKGQFLFCVRGDKTMMVFSTMEEDAQEAKDVCHDHLKATQNTASRLVGLNRLVKGMLNSSLLTSYTRQAWASCQASLPVHDGVFYPKWLLTVKQDALAARKGAVPQQSQHAQHQQTESAERKLGASADASPSPALQAPGTSSVTGKNKGVTGWLSSKLFGKAPAATYPTDGSASHTAPSSTVDTTSATVPRPAAPPPPRSAVERLYTPPRPMSIAECVLIWEHDTPNAVTTVNFQRFGTANVPSVAASAAPAGTPNEHGNHPFAISSDPSRYVSTGPGGRCIAKKVVLDCATCDGSFVSIRLYTESAQLQCSPAVPFQLK